MHTQEVYQTYGDRLYFFILKKVKDKEVANDILQNSFVKIHTNLPKLKDETKVRAWTFQIARNELANYYGKENQYVDQKDSSIESNEAYVKDCCCFDRFLEQLAPSYRDVIEQVYIKGMTQEQAAIALGLSLANVKARIRKSKALLKEQFMSCCNYTLNAKGKLVGEVDCAHCQFD